MLSVLRCSWLSLLEIADLQLPQQLMAPVPPGLEAIDVTHIVVDKHHNERAYRRIVIMVAARHQVGAGDSTELFRRRALLARARRRLDPS